MKIRQWKQSYLTTARDFTVHQEALLSAVILDRRHNGWAFAAASRSREMLLCAITELTILLSLAVWPGKTSHNSGGDWLILSNSAKSPRVSPG
jgi:hypothetical protein